MTVPCPFCAEQIDKAAVKCKHCGEFLDDPAQPQSSGSGKTVLIVLAIVFGGGLCCIMLIAAIAIPNLIEARKHGNEAAAIGALKTISTAQSLFREGDKEGDGNLDYGSRDELASAGGYGLIDSVLGSGTKQGYLFDATYSATTSEFIWFATASPAVPGTTGTRYFAANQEGVIYYSPSGPIPMNTVDCTFPQNRLDSGDIRPVGR